ncbi:hypothetical protein SELMODRAFT_175383 [Selaginella moellendorffii]|uniref:Uncharacterized protein GCR1-1_2 n=1 Tax=Selaginella moellendorffii TaxID=88036 RepID=D8RY89_SELML|nr:G-protein coupled receptor 1 [Selaginella moellendorffii]EFJ23056.1 hypothetical protein SELMODRAFT_175383 [Selaginella moellendorffii]|eukprot:XP_002976151.1 G-protein coupled receptor 1 [Selaginella moellendorffii]
MIAGLSAEEARAISRINVGASAFSFAGSFFIVACFLLFKELRKFSFRLVFYLSLSDMFCSFFNLLGDPGRRGFLCYMQGYCTQFFSVASFLWTTAIAFTLHRTVVRHKTDVEELGPIFHLYVWGASLIMTVLPSVGTDYGEVGAWCWVQTKAGEVLRFISFYVPLWGAILFNGFIYFQVTRMLNYASRMAAGMSDRQRQVEIKADLKIMNRLGYYPLILIGSWTCGTMNRIQSFIAPQRPVFWLCLLDVGTASLMGLFNSIAYGLNAAVRRTLRERLQQYWPEQYRWSKLRGFAESEMTPLSSSDPGSHL